MRKILLADDDSEYLDFYRTALSDAGYEVSAATDGVRAIAALDRTKFDVVITDLVMPYIDGERVARIAKRRYPGEEPLVILLSAAAVESSVHRNPHVDAYVAKGNPKATLKLLEEVIERPPQRNALRKPPHVTGRRITRELLRTEEQLNLVLEQMSQGVVQLTPDTVVLSANRAALSYLSTEEDDLLGRRLLEILNESASQQLTVLFREPLREGERRRVTIAIDDAKTYLRAELIVPAGKEKELLILFLTDVTSEHAVSQYLEHSGHTYRTIVDSTSDLLWTVDTENSLTYISPGTLRFTGYSAEEYHRHGLPLLLGATKWEALDILSEAQDICSRGESYQFEKQLPVKNDGRVWSLVRVSPLLDLDGTFLGVTFAATNIHRRKRAENQLRRAVLERETLIKEIHHRVKNSVQIIISMIRLRLGTYPTEEVRLIAEGLENRIRIIAGVYAQLYEYKSLDRLDGSALIKRSVELARDQMPNFEVNLEGDPFELTLDAAIPLALLVRELTRNVAYHVYPTTNPARLLIRWTIAGSECEITFSDNGPGLEPAHIEDPETLGFLIAQSCAAQLRGGITSDSRDGQGTTIVVRCPHEAPPPLEETETITPS